MDTCAKLNKWRHLIEPVVRESVTPMPWARVLAMPVSVYEGANSVLLTVDSVFQGAPCCQVWVAAGEMSQVLALADQAEVVARERGLKNMVYLGRPGWVRAAGYREAAVVGVKEL